VDSSLPPGFSDGEVASPMSSSGRPAILVFLQQTPSALICERIFEGFQEEKGKYRVNAFVAAHDGLVLRVNGEISDFRQDILSDCPPRGYVPSSSALQTPTKLCASSEL
jgi:hypothetical protein